MIRERHKNKRVVSILANGVTDTSSEVVTVRNTPVMWGIPMDEVLFSKFIQLYFKHAYFMPWDGFAFTESTYLPDARNAIHNAFITDSNLPYLMMLDSDILFPAHTVDRLLAHNLPVVNGWYRNKQVQMEHHPIVYDWVGSGTGKDRWRHRREPGQGLEKVDGVGMGCMLMSRDAAITLGTNPYNTQDGGEDLNVCKKMMDKSIDVYVDWSIDCAHLGIKWT